MANLVNNPSFTDDLNGWLTTGTVNAVASQAGTQARTLPFSAGIGMATALGSIEQEVVHEIGGLYQLIFYTNAIIAENLFTLTLGDGPAAVTILSAMVSFDGPPQPQPVIVNNMVQLFLLVTGPTPDDYPQFTITYIVNQTNILLQFETFINATFLDDVSIIQLAAPCYMSDTEIYVKNTETDLISYVPVKDITFDKYLVYSKKLDKFIPIRSVTVSKSGKRMVLIKKILS